MEQVHGTPEASKFEPQDFISSMPDNVITNILDHLPIQDAVKTDVLSKNWKFKWTLLTRLIFDEKFFDNLLHNLPDKFVGKIISRLLLHLKGPITKFVLYMPVEVEGDEYILDLEDIRHWVMFLSRRGIKEFTFKCIFGDRFYLPTQLYSCMELKHLELCNVYIPPLPSFHRFANLLSLHLHDVVFVDHTFGEFISRCPLLEILSNYDLNDRCKLELTEICKLANLKILSWSMCMDHSGPIPMIKSSSFYQLTGLPKLQELNLDFGLGKFMAEAGVAKKAPAAFLCLKTLTLSRLNLSCDIMASFVLIMICNSPNLQNLNITGEFNHDVSPSAVCSLDLGCNTTKQLQLRNVAFSSYQGSENEVFLIKFILTSSPLLKKIVISVNQYFLKRQRAGSERYDIAWKMAGKLLKLHRASPIVEIELC